MDSQLKLCLIAMCSVVSTSFLAVAEEAKNGGANVDLTKIRSQITIAHRKNGPFGLSQDLTVKKVVPQKEVKPDVFPKAIAAIHINMVSVSGGSFYIGLEEIKKGEVFPLEYGKNKFNVRVSSIEKGQIIFQNMATQEQIIKRLDSLPIGMQRGGGALEAIEGVIPANEKKSGVIRVGGDTTK